MVVLLILKLVLLASLTDACRSVYFEVEEEQAALTLIGDLSLVDCVIEPYHLLIDLPTFRKKGQTAFGNLTVVEPNGVVKTDRVIDREDICPGSEICLIKVQAEVLHSQMDTVTVDMIIRIRDINDNEPQHTQETISINIDGIYTTVTALKKIHVSDQDEGSNGTACVEFELSADSQDRAFFSTDGILYTFCSIPDCSGLSCSQYDTILRATKFPSDYPDFPPAPNIDVQESPANEGLTINIHYVAVFQIGLPTKTVRIPENASPGTQFVIPFFSLYVDAESSNVATLEHGASGHLSTNTSFGKITVVQALDRETNNIYVIKIGNIMRLVVDIIDVNDNPPRLTFPNDQSYTVNLQVTAVGLQLGDFVIQAVATDADESLNARLIYSLDNGEIFTIHPVTGRVTVKEATMITAAVTYTMIVWVEDLGTPSLSASNTLTINLTPATPPPSIDSEE